MKPFRDYLSQPVNKLKSEVAYGMLSSDSLKEDVDLHHTVKRLRHMLGKHKLWQKIEDEELSRKRCRTLFPSCCWHGHSSPALCINAAAPLLVHLFATNPSSVVRMRGYALFPRNPLRTNVLRNHHGDLCIVQASYA